MVSEIGVLSRFVPVEILHAAGVNPRFMWCHVHKESAERSLGEMLRFINPYDRAVVGENKKNTISSYIIAQTDCHVARTGETLEASGATIYPMGIAPLDYDSKESIEYFIHEIKSMKVYLEEKAGVKIKDDEIIKYLQDYDHIREQLCKIKQLRDNNPGFLKGSQFVNLQFQTFRICERSTKEAVAFLNQTLKEFENKIPCNKADDVSPKIMIISHVFVEEDLQMLKMIEKCGCIISEELADEGLFDLHKDRSVSEDPINAIAKNRINSAYPPNFFQGSFRKRYEYAKSKIQKKQADAILWYQLSFDEIYDLEYSMWAKWAAEDEIPFLRLETSYEETDEERENMITRVESFVQMLEWRI